MNRYILTIVVFLAVLSVNADRTEQGNLLQQNTLDINGEEDGVVTLHLGPLGSPPTLKCNCEQPTTIGVHAKPLNEFPNPLPSDQGVLSLGLAGYAGIEITSSNADANCEFELTTVDLTAFLTGDHQKTGILCDDGVGSGGPGPHNTSSSTGGTDMFNSSTGSSSTGEASTGLFQPNSTGDASSSTGILQLNSTDESSTGESSTGESTGEGESSSTGPQSSSTGEEEGPQSSSTGDMSSTGDISSTGVSTEPPTWECVPVDTEGGKLIAKFVKTGIYVFVSIETVFQAVLEDPYEILAGLNRTVEWADEFAMEIKTQAHNTLNVNATEETDKGDADQRHRDCGEDMGHFYDLDFARLDVDFEIMLLFKYTEEMLTQKGHCNTCGKYLRFAFFDELTSLWKFSEESTEVDIINKEIKQYTKNSQDEEMPKSWAVMYAAELLNGTSSSGDGFTGDSGGGFTGDSTGGFTGFTGGDRSGVEARWASVPLVGVLAVVALALVR